MNRREAVWRIAVLMGGAMVGGEVFLSGQTLPGKAVTEGFTDEDRALLDEIGETIIPATAIPGAKAVGIGAFMAMMVTDCYNDRQHATFKAGLGRINEAARAKWGKPFVACSAEERTALANQLDAEQKAHHAAKSASEEAHYFRMMKELSVLGFFSSQVGATQAVHYVEVPGSYNGNVPYKKGDGAWY